MIGSDNHFPRDFNLSEAEGKNLKYGWTTGACAAAASKAAFEALVTGRFENTVTIKLPKGQTPTFEVVKPELTKKHATAGIIKDAGDDPDVTHGAMIVAKISKGGSGVTFKAGEGVGTVTKPGLPLDVGEPAINPAPRQMIENVIKEVATAHNEATDVIVEISVPGGVSIAKKTWNGRLGIVGGLSILGTTGIVVPYSCSAWIHSIHRGIDVARATKLTHIGAAVGNTSEKLLMSHHGLDEQAIIDMGDFVGGMLKYLKKNPVPSITIAGGFGKMSKLAGGAMDLHSKRSQVDKKALGKLLAELGADEKTVNSATEANTALEILELAGAQKIPLGDRVAAVAADIVREKLDGTGINIEILICDRTGKMVGSANIQNASKRSDN